MSKLTPQIKQQLGTILVSQRKLDATYQQLLFTLKNSFEFCGLFC
jgi:hypothetical protein